MSDAACHICGERALQAVPGYWRLFRVTSDCRPWRQGGTLAVCGACGVAQKPLDDAWLRETTEIYASYALYPQAGGAEQAVFAGAFGMPEPRSRRLLDRVLAEVSLPDEGRLLDLGCGNGALLRSFHSLRPRWRLEGAELNDRHRAAVESLPGVTRYHSCSPDTIPGRFDLVTLLHVLEHVGGPRKYLETLVDRIEPGGRLLVESPDASRNPFDLVIADHATHFTQASLVALIEASGYSIERSAGDWIPKEASVLAVPCLGKVTSPRLEQPGSIADVERGLSWLESVRSHAASYTTSTKIGVFGTSIAGSWLWAELRNGVGYFVDEDPQRVGRTYLGCPVLAPHEVPTGGVVYVALTPTIAREVSARCARPDVTYVVPPDLTEPGDLPQHRAR
ncbi:MAG: class I SAM-dependent methyltransferase [Planctomycetota bacterium]